MRMRWIAAPEGRDIGVPKSPLHEFRLLCEDLLGNRQFQLLLLGRIQSDLEVFVMQRELETERVLIGKHGG